MADSDFRSSIAEALDGWLTPEQLRTLLDEILASTKSVRADCPSCKKSVSIQVADSRAVVDGLATLAAQGFGRPRESSGGAEHITFERVVYLTEDPERLLVAEAKLRELGFTIDSENVPVPLH
jgi:hypothetical protein